jgi:uncharacterized protein YigA (DUF484 family)
MKIVPKITADVPLIQRQITQLTADRDKLDRQITELTGQIHNNDDIIYEFEAGDYL